MDSNVNVGVTIYVNGPVTINRLNTITQDRDLWKKISHVSAHSAIGVDGEM